MRWTVQVLTTLTSDNSISKTCGSRGNMVSKRNYDNVFSLNRIYSPIATAIEKCEMPFLKIIVFFENNFDK